MSNIRITKQFNFETGHALYGYDGKCKNIHGHSYKLSVTVIGKPITDTSHVKLGMVIDFGDLKWNILQKPSRTEVSTVKVGQGLAEELINLGHNVILADYQPTSENMVIDFAVKIKARLPKNIKLHSLKLQETDTALAEWFASDN